MRWSVITPTVEVNSIFLKTCMPQPQKTTDSSPRVITFQILRHPLRASSCGDRSVGLVAAHGAGRLRLQRCWSGHQRSVNLPFRVVDAAASASAIWTSAAASFSV